MALDDTWFTEIHQADGSAFSLKIKAKLHDEQTPFQHIEIYDTVHWGKLMTIAGFYMLSTRDNFLYHEMMSHPALFTHAAPKRVLIIGDSTDPIGPAEGLFNRAFYEQCHRILRSGGLLVQQSESPLYHLQLLK